MKSQNILSDLNPEQKQAVTTTEGPLLIIAGAGTGKTAVIARRIAYIIEKKLAKPSEILALTFTDKAAAEMEERVDVLVPYGFIDTWISTFHAFGDRILRDNALEIGLAPDFKVLSRPQQVLFFQQNLFRFDLDYWRPLGNPTKFIGAILSFFSRLKDENVSPEEFKKFVTRNTKHVTKEEKIEAKKYQELTDAYEKYEKFKDKAGFLDFGDQVVKTIQLFKRRPKILTNYQNHFKYILVDEYQDTNFAQNELVKTLASGHKNICVVGDDDQSIYKFRGAAISNILEFKKTYPKSKQVVLTQNYRSTQAILDSAYKLIRHNDPDRLEVKNKINKRLKSIKKEFGLPPQEILADTLSQEADLVAEEIEKLMAKKRVKGQLSNVRVYSFRDFAILVRTNAAADHFLRALNMHGIAHKFVGSSGLYQQEEIATLVSFLTAITNFEDSLNLFNLVTSEIYQLPSVDAIKLTSYARRKNRSLYYILKGSAIKNNDLEITGKSQSIIEKLLGDLDEAIKLSRKQNVGRVLYDFIKRTDYLKKLERHQSPETQIKIQNIAKFFDKIKDFASVAQIESAQQFVDYLEAIRTAGDDPATVEFDPELDAVNVMTVHGAKGLEFPVVFLVNLVSDHFPTRSRSKPIDVPEKLIRETLPAGDWHMQEERRLFYVGATRARDFLYFSHARDVGARRIKKVSPFVLEALDRPQLDQSPSRLSPFEKIEKFAPSPKSAGGQKGQQPLFLDVEVIKLTQGAVDDYLTCAYKYRYIHILKIPILRHHAVVYGAALHAAVAAFLRSKKSGKIMTLVQMLEVFENAWDTEGFLTIEHEERRKEAGKLALKSFYKRELKTKDVPSLIETGFKFSLDGVTVTGRYDRIDVRAQSKVTIIDYKSSENINQEKATNQAKESIQLAIYALAYFKNYQIIPERIGLNFLENGQEGWYSPKKEDLDKTEALILETAQKIRKDSKNNKFIANPKYFGREPACVYCAYNTICPFSLAKI